MKTFRSTMILFFGLKAAVVAGTRPFSSRNQSGALPHTPFTALTLKITVAAADRTPLGTQTPPYTEDSTDREACLPCTIILLLL